ncbi:toll/interleukin-1 receptor domain-containing protein [Segetibacter sp. 3557_3]|uniref:toll/interleukin-1 receptor domain-containing protein n=1 Tax=Segetibacter sp. 3557_3 TaxID=2547429 RepID=UPI0010590598|nr:toll/interleukin-1 receptor domain-containing protein [Segetibacter sp. 3557_3]TDH24254.1 toll/interleukin-1 receptor domain-containing protein [Segetibacter sp. 3557_3]
MADIFISYSSEDKSIVEKLAARLEKKGWSVWWDRHIPIGCTYDDVIESALQEASCVVVIWTKRSVRSEWVKNEASAAVQRGVLVPIVLEQVTLPIAFRRIESAMLLGWNGEDEHPELELFFKAIANILHQPAGGPGRSEPKNNSWIPDKYNGLLYAIFAIAALLVCLLVYRYLNTFINNEPEQFSRSLAYLLLGCLGISAGAVVIGAVKSYSAITSKTGAANLKNLVAIAVLLPIVAGALILPSDKVDNNLTVRVFDFKKNPVSQGDVTIYLPEYVRTGSIDKKGQALFTGLPNEFFKKTMKIEVASPGYATSRFDTILTSSRPLEVLLPLSTVVYISGKVKTAAELPIKDVEVNVDGTRYYALSINDGSYKLRLEEYTLGDEITLTTSHEKYEDKSIVLKIDAPEMEKIDIFLNPVTLKNKP